MAARTTRLRLGVAVRVLPLSHPLRIAEETATLDQISEGRLDFGIGRSGSPRSYDALGVPYGESQARFREALTIVVEAWKGEPFSYHGEFYDFNEIAVSPRSYQQPHPPLRMAATSADTFPLVGELGLPIFVGLRGGEVAQLRGNLEAYRASWRAAGHGGDGDVLLRIPLYRGADRGRKRSRSRARARSASSSDRRRSHAPPSAARAAAPKISAARRPNASNR